MDDFERELKTGFLEEASQLLTDIEQCFLSLEKNPQDIPTLEQIFRAAHNLKGSARAVGFIQMGEFTHHLESFLLKLKTGELAVKTSTVNLLLRCNDRIRTMVEALKGDLDAQTDASDLLAEIQLQLNGHGDEATPTPSADQFSDDTDALLAAAEAEAVAAVSASLQTPAETPAEASPPPETALSETPAAEPAPSEVPAEAEAHAAASSSEATTPVAPATPPPTSPQAQSPTPKPAASAPAPTETKRPAAGGNTSQADETLRVSLRRLEKLMNNVGELVILQTVLDQQRFQIASPLVQKTIVQLAKITKDIQEMSMSLRMVPLKQTFQKMQRIVRDTSQALGKEIHLELAGEETEIDKTLVESLGDPLVHLVRNAADHGIESAEERVSKGKPPHGKIDLRAFQRGGNIVIEVQDDGKGLDAAKLRAKATEKGILRPGQTLSDAESHALIFHPGFSTKTEVTDISGRGVGMDVVKTNIEKLMKGEVQLETELGKGTCLRILLPLTLAIIDGMIIQSGDERYVVPIAQIHESIQPSLGDIHFFSGVGEMLSLRGTNYPLFRLTQIMGRKAAKPKPANECIAIIAASQEQPFAVLVDDITGQQQVVIKKLGDEIRDLQGISGGAILGDGRAALILDLNELAQRARRLQPASAPSAAPAAAASATSLPSQKGKIA